MTQVWRLHVRPEGFEEGTDPTRFCIEQGVVGVDWGGLDREVSADITPGQYVKHAQSEGYGKNDLKGFTPVFNALSDRMKTNDLCWTRDTAGVYYLGRIDGGRTHCELHSQGWHFYGHDPYFRKNNLNQGRSCHWVRVGTAARVAGVIKNRFIRGQAVNQIASETAVIFSQYVYNVVADDYKYALSEKETNLWELLSPDDSEDLVGAWLQLAEGYYLVPSTCKVGTPKYEYELVHRQTGERAFVQVKNGYEDLNRAEYTELLREGTVYLLTTRGSYKGKVHDKIFSLNPESLEQFARQNRSMLPDNIRKWMDLVDDLGDSMSRPVHQ